MLPTHKKALQKVLGSPNSIGILGFGMEGRSSFKTIRSIYPHTTIHIFDQSESINAPKDDALTLHLGKNYLNNINECEVLLRSPGIKLPSGIYKGTVTSQSQLFTEICRAKIVGITGTKGKSTVTSLTHRLLSADFEVAIGGNIGKPMFELLDKAYDYYVCEYSCHQLSDMTVSPKYAMLLNLFPEHLDYYESVEAYFDAKRNIYRHQSEEDYFIENTPQIKHNDIGIYLTESVTTWCSNLAGKHNISNQLFAIQMALHLGATPANIANQLASFTGLPHRLECIYSSETLRIINDSISTIPQSTIAAINSFEDVSAVLIGGFDRTIDYAILTKYIEETDSFVPILFSDVGKRIVNSLVKDVPYFETFQEATNFALSTFCTGTIIMSPGASSFDEFSSFTERGNTFKNLVTKHFSDASL